MPEKVGSTCVRKDTKIVCVYKDTKAIMSDQDTGLCKGFVAYDTSPSNVHEPLFGLGVDNSETAMRISDHFKKLAKAIRKAEECIGVKGFANILKKETKSPRGSKKAKKLTTTRQPSIKDLANRAKKSAQNLG